VGRIRRRGRTAVPGHLHSHRRAAAAPAREGDDPGVPPQECAPTPRHLPGRGQTRIPRRYPRSGTRPPPHRVRDAPPGNPGARGTARSTPTGRRSRARPQQAARGAKGPRGPPRPAPTHRRSRGTPHPAPRSERAAGLYLSRCRRVGAISPHPRELARVTASRARCAGKPGSPGRGPGGGGHRPGAGRFCSEEGVSPLRAGPPGGHRRRGRPSR
jgi:translation initiation factor IF-2